MHGSLPLGFQFMFPFRTNADHHEVINTDVDREYFCLRVLYLLSACANMIISFWHILMHCFWRFVEFSELPKSSRFMDTLSYGMIAINALIKLVAESLKCHTKNLLRGHLLEWNPEEQARAARLVEQLRWCNTEPDESIAIEIKVRKWLEFPLQTSK